MSRIDSTVRGLLHDDFASFARKGMDTLGISNGGEDRYIDVLCSELMNLESAVSQRLVVNLPPRHLKTTLCSELFPAWVLGRSPGTRILVVTCSEALTREIAHKTRGLIQSHWFADAFPKARLASDKKAVMDFSTTQGGSLFATTIGGAITGRGGDLIIVDDPVELRDAANEALLTEVNTRFDTVISSRLNNPKTGRMLIVAHRLHSHDLSGHVLEQGGWCHVCLPMMATRSIKYGTCGGPWRRRAGELLRPDAFLDRDVQHLRHTCLNPDFETLYQQNPDGELAVHLETDHFSSFEGGKPGGLPVVLSIDPGHAAGSGNSFSVIQAWCKRADVHLLIDQWREQTEGQHFLEALRRFRRFHRPSCILIERTGLGLLAMVEANRRNWKGAVPIVPDGRSKQARLLEHVQTILRGGISLPAQAPWRHEFITEFVTFPRGDFDDQVDAATQYLDWASKHPSDLKMPPQRPCVGMIGGKVIRPHSGGRVWFPGSR